MNRRSLLLGTTAVALLRTHPALAQVYYGEFIGELQGTFLATDPPLFKLTAPFAFKDPNGTLWEVPEGIEVDGASIPRVFWIIASPFTGPYLFASVIHDHFCTTRNRTAHDTHRDFYYGMMAREVAAWQASFMYWAVATFGPQWELTASSGLALPDDVRLVLAGNAEGSLRLEDPVLLAAAKAKAAAIARTLHSTNGEVLDPGARGTVPANLEAIEASAAYYREVFASGAYLDDPRLLGVLSLWTSDIAEATWRGEIPNSDRVPDVRALIQGETLEDLAFTVNGDGRAANAELFMTIDQLGGVE